jgi:uncharacterized repeat protein (TIGR01451 family)
MRRDFVKILSGGIILFSMVCGLSLMSVNAQDTSGPMDLPTRPTPNVQPSPSPEVKPLPNLPDLSVVVGADRGYAQVGDTVKFTITLSNPDTIKGRGVKLLGLIPPVFDVVEMTTTQGVVSYKAETGRLQVYNFSPLQPNTSVTVTVLVRVNNLAEEGQKYYTAAKVEQGNRPNTKDQFSNWFRLEIGSE